MGELCPLNDFFFRFLLCYVRVELCHLQMSTISWPVSPGWSASLFPLRRAPQDSLLGQVPPVRRPAPGAQWTVESSPSGHPSAAWPPPQGHQQHTTGNSFNISSQKSGNEDQTSVAKVWTEIRVALCITSKYRPYQIFACKKNWEIGNSFRLWKNTYFGAVLIVWLAFFCQKVFNYGDGRLLYENKKKIYFKILWLHCSKNLRILYE